jgi:hypothetical protein
MKEKLKNEIGMKAGGFHGSQAGTQSKAGSSSFRTQAGHHGKARFLPLTFSLLPLVVSPHGHKGGSRNKIFTLLLVTCYLFVTFSLAAKIRTLPPPQQNRNR